MFATQGATATQKQIKPCEISVVASSHNEPTFEGLTLLTINFGTGKQKAGVTARRDAVKTAIEVTPKYDLIFAQEIPGHTKPGYKLWPDGTRKYQCLPATKEAGLMYSEEKITLKTNVDAGMKISAQDKAMENKTVAADLNARSTAAVFTVSVPGSTPYFILAISWHGPHTQAKNFDTKKEIFILLQKFANILKYKLEKMLSITIADIIIGGDFNIDLTLLNDALVEGFCIKVSWRSDGKKNIDGFVFKSNCRVIGTSLISDLTALDHKPMEMKMKPLKVIVTETEE